MSDSAAIVTLMKPCKKCGSEKPLWAFKKDKFCRHGVTGVCLECFNKRRLVYRADNMERYRERERAHHQKRWFLNAIYNQLYKLVFPERNARSQEQAAKNREYAARTCESCSDAYVRKCLREGFPSLRRVEIPQSLIAAKRLQIQIKRHIKEASK